MYAMRRLGPSPAKLLFSPGHGYFFHFASSGSIGGPANSHVMPRRGYILNFARSSMTFTLRCARKVTLSSLSWHFLQLCGRKDFPMFTKLQDLSGSGHFCYFALALSISDSQTTLSSTSWLSSQVCRPLETPFAISWPRSRTKLRFHPDAGFFYSFAQRGHLTPRHKAADSATSWLFLQFCRSEEERGPGPPTSPPAAAETQG